jgi:NAD(P)-dependent dehydrogenase (short-subunit alcohol dehydrogenase family)
MTFDPTVAAGRKPMLSGKRAIITGGANGIGRAAVDLFVAAGARVLTCDREPGGLEELRARHGDAVRTVVGDVSTHEGVDATVTAAIEWLGGIDILYNNAGIGTLTDDFPLVHQTPYDVFERTFACNAWSTFALCRETLPHMGGTTPGSIINVASILALVAGAGSVSYIASKGAVLALTKSIAYDYGSRAVRANVICPGFVDTRMASDYTSKAPDPVAAQQEFADAHLLRRIGKPEEIAAAALWLGSDASSFVTGAVIPVDGGYTAR